MSERLRYKLDNYEKAVHRLQEAVQLPLEQSIVLDGIIQRFEFTYELAWKLMKSFLEYEGIVEVSSPRAVFKEAYSIGLISNSEDWLSMIADRNITSHTYDEKMALLVCERITTQHVHILVTLLETLKQRILSL
ncbi:nucleotidyltransferase substrate binding protein [Mesobacillus foraminis]|uniref:nucleotidyltransferase substrate binding protein n=1 Tax=Mesobacillus foraminis TaxID=279826 RepID=UPI001BE4F275|nr:nucleotidyltransferase substrate binding protein [Mesobacillus foraminis]MBT2756851.1 nucleotidyltransferase substrate binding protein [Mesobacillus foraminis]